jgi:hypothetical protein
VTDSGSVVPVGELAGAIANELDRPVTVDIQVMETDRSLVGVAEPVDWSRPPRE